MSSSPPWPGSSVPIPVREPATPVVGVLDRGAEVHAPIASPPTAQDGTIPNSLSQRQASIFHRATNMPPRLTARRIGKALTREPRLGPAIILITTGKRPARTSLGRVRREVSRDPPARSSASTTTRISSSPPGVLRGTKRGRTARPGRRSSGTLARERRYGRDHDRLRTGDLEQLAPRGISMPHTSVAAPTPATSNHRTHLTGTPSQTHRHTGSTCHSHVRIPSACKLGSRGDRPDAVRACLRLRRGQAAWWIGQVTCVTVVISTGILPEGRLDGDIWVRCGNVTCAGYYVLRGEGVSRLSVRDRRNCRSGNGVTHGPPALLCSPDLSLEHEISRLKWCAGPPSM